MRNGRRQNLQRALLGRPERGVGDEFSIKKYPVTDKHGPARDVFNAKINIYREQADPIFLGCQDAGPSAFAPVADGTEIASE